MIRFIIKRPVLVGMLFVGLCLLGMVSYFNLPVELIPFAELPMLVVHVQSARDADPEYVEKEAIIALEGAIGSLDDIDRLESIINRGRATIFVYYNENANIKYAYLKLQERVESAKSKLGEEFLVLVLKIDTEQLSNMFMSLQVRGSGGLDRIRHVVDKEIVQGLENVDGIANVEVYGGRQRSVEILLNADALRAQNITPQQVEARIAAARGSRVSLGNAFDADRKYFVNLVADYTDISELENTVIKDKGPVLLKHVAEVRDGGKEEESISRVNGKEAITVSLIRDAQSNLISLSHSTHSVIEDLNRQLASDDVEIVIQSDAAEIIEDNVDLIKQLALIGGLLAVAILWIFLRNFRLVLIIAAAIPISVLVSLNFFYAFDISINTLTLVGLVLASGMLLDNSIVVMESIYRKLARGIDVEEAVVTGTGEVIRAVSAATLTTICVFLPFVYSGNFLIRVIGRHVGVSIIATLIVSLVVAFLLIPAFTYGTFRRRSSVASRSFNIVSQRNRLFQLYTLVLKSSLRFPARTILTGIVLFFVSVVICLALSIGIPEEAELREFNLYAEMPSGTTLESADELVRGMETRLEDLEEVEDRIVKIYEDNAIFTFQLKEDYKSVAKRVIPQIKDDIMEKLEDGFPRVDFSYEQPVSDVRYRAGGGGYGGGGGPQGGGGEQFMRLLGIGSQRETIKIRGSDYPLMRQIADEIKFNLDNLDFVDWSRVSLSEGRPEIHLLFDKSTLSHFSVTLANVMAELSSFQEEYTSNVKFKQGTEDIDIVLRNESLEEKTADDIRTLEIQSTTGGTVPVLQLAQLIYSTGFYSISRVNQEQEIGVSYRFEENIRDSKTLLESSREEIDLLVESMELPAGIAVEVIHDETDYSDFYFLIAAAFILIYMVLASAFESLTTPLVIMFTIPLATIGAFWGLILTGQSVLNANSMIGFLILLGIVVNNGIILIDYSRLLNRRGFRPIRALLAAGQARVRPILITSITTIVALIPLAMGEAEYVAKIGAPFAITVIGGLVVGGTLFTLIFIPTVYSGTQNALVWWRSLGARTKLIQIILFACGCWLIYDSIDSFIWRLAALCALTSAIPGMTYFALTSLRRAKTEIIPASEPIKITVRNIVKSYDDYSRFVREYRKGDRQTARFEREGFRKHSAGLLSLLWQLPIYVFLVYFVYIYLDSGFWLFVLSHAVYLYTIKLSRPFLDLQKDAAIEKPIRMRRLRKFAFKMFFWGIPLANLILFYFRWEDLALVLIIAPVWYLALAVYSTSRKLYREKIDINRIAGRFRRTRRLFYRFVKVIPVIGKKKNPFRALNQVSMQIESGMFGLIGPNGAGKTTLMRVICGILDQSRGSIRINDIDLNKNREEFQGLIGYLPQEFGTYQNMTAFEFLDHQAMLRGIWDAGRRRMAVERAISSVHLDESRDTRIKAFSGGMKQRVGIAQTLLHLPRILVVDEPTAGLDPRERIRFRNLLSELARDRVVIFSTHVIEDISSSCNRVAVLDEGRVKFLGKPQDMVASTEGHVWQAYISAEQFEKVRNDMRVVHHMRDGDRIRIRVLADEQPLPEAKQATPTLEDSYLWIIGNRN